MASSIGGVTVFLTTQYLDEADQLADRIALIDAGRIVAEGTPGQLKKEVAEQRLVLQCTDDARVLASIVDLLGVRVERARAMQGGLVDGRRGKRWKCRRQLRGVLDEGRARIATGVRARSPCTRRRSTTCSWR